MSLRPPTSELEKGLQPEWVEVLRAHRLNYVADPCAMQHQDFFRPRVAHLLNERDEETRRLREALEWYVAYVPHLAERGKAALEGREWGKHLPRKGL